MGIKIDGVSIPLGGPGVGVPKGGSSGQVLTKKSNNNYDTEWSALPQATSEQLGLVKSSSGTDKVTVAEDGTMSVSQVSVAETALDASNAESANHALTCETAQNGIPTGGNTGQILIKKSNTDNDVIWSQYCRQNLLFNSIFNDWCCVNSLYWKNWGTVIQPETYFIDMWRIEIHNADTTFNLNLQSDGLHYSINEAGDIQLKQTLYNLKPNKHYTISFLTINSHLSWGIGMRESPYIPLVGGSIQGEQLSTWEFDTPSDFIGENYKLGLAFVNGVQGVISAIKIEEGSGQTLFNSNGTYTAIPDSGLEQARCRRYFYAPLRYAYSVTSSDVVHVHNSIYYVAKPIIFPAVMRYVPTVRFYDSFTNVENALDNYGNGALVPNVTISPNDIYNSGIDTIKLSGPFPDNIIGYCYYIVDANKW